MESIKVCLLTSEFLPNWGGVGTYCIELARALAEKVELHVVTIGRKERGKLVYSKEDMEDLFNGKIEIDLLTECSTKDTFIYNGKMQLAVYKRFHNRDELENFDLIHTNIPQMADILLRIRGRIQIPSVVTVHTTIEGHKDGISQACQSSGLTFSNLDLSEKSILFMYPALKLAERLYIRRSDAFITVSNWMKEILKRKHPSISRIHVIHNGVDSKRFSPEYSKNLDILDEFSGPIVLFSSRLTALKGTYFFIRAIPKILRKIKSAHFVFAGAGSKEPWIELLERLNVDRSFYTFLGHVDYELVPSLYSKSDLLVVPSLYENLPFVILEAMSSESAIVASNIGGIPEVITNGENGVLFSPGNVDELTKVSLMLLEDEKLRNRLGRNARKTVIRRFSWSKIAESTFGAYKEALET